MPLGSRCRHLLVLVSLVMTFDPMARAQQLPRLGGRLEYTGALGPVSPQRPLCLCVYHDRDLSEPAGCFTYDSPRTEYVLGAPAVRDYFLIAFLEIQVNGRLDVGEPFEIYRDRGAPPADVATANIGVDDLDLVFGDEHLPNGGPTPTVTPTATPSPTPAVCAGDCDGSGAVTFAEIVELLGELLTGHGSTDCVPTGMGPATLELLVAATANAGAGCP